MECTPLPDTQQYIGRGFLLYSTSLSQPRMLTQHLSWQGGQTQPTQSQGKFDWAYSQFMSKQREKKPL